MSALKLSVTYRFIRPFFGIVSIAALLASPSMSAAQLMSKVQLKSTKIEISGATAQSTVNRLGVTLGGEAWIDGGPLRKNLVVNNPGFEAAEYRAILRCAVVTADTCQVADAATAEPAGFWNGAHYFVMSGGAAGAAGTIVSDTSVGDGSVLALDTSLSLSAGNYLAVEVQQSGSGVTGWSSSLTGGGKIAAETTDLSPETAGKRALLLSAQGRGGAVLSQDMDAQTDQSKLQLNGAYELSFRAKGVAGNNQLNVSVARGANSNAPYLNRSVALTESWAEYTLSFSASETGTKSSPLQLSFAAAGANIELDDVSLQQSNSSSANTTAFRDEVVNALQDLHPGTIRMVSAGSDVLTQLASPFARPSQGLSNDGTTASGTAYGIQEFLQLCATVGADPWITVPASTTPVEMADLVQYLTGEGSDTWSGMRIARGQAEPWTSVFGTVHIELESAIGISGSASQPMASSAYAVWSNAVFGAARRGPGYSASRIDLILSGSAASTSWNASVASASKQQDPPFTTTQLNSTKAAAQTPAATSSTLVKGLNTTLNVSPVAAVATQAATTSVSSTPVINYPSGFAGSPSAIWLEAFATYSGSSIHLVPSVVHNASNAWFKTPENVQAFTTTFGFHVVCPPSPVACGDGLGFMIIADNSAGNPTYNPSAGQPGYTYSGFSGGQFSWSQCEIPITPISEYCFNNGTNGNTGSDLKQLPQNILVKFDLVNNQANVAGANITGYYTDGEYPQAPYAPQYDMAPSGINIQSGDEFSCTLTYNGTTLTESLTDTVTGATYTNSYAANIPTAVGGNTGFIGFGGGVGADGEDVYIDSWTYATGASTPPATATPIFSQAAGTYAGPLTVTVSDTTSGATIYYTTNGTTPTTSSAKYTGALTVSSTETLEAIAVASGYSNSAVASAAYTISSSTEATTYINNGSGAFKASSFDLDGASVTSGGVLQVTDGGTGESRSAWFATKVPVQTFTTDFTFEQLNATADGMTFTIQGQGSNALGGGGGSLGYAGITKSVAIKFDLYDNLGEGTDSTGLYTNGAPPCLPAVNLSPSGIVLRSGDLMHAHLVYDGTNLTMTLTDTVTKATATEVFPVNIPSMVGGDTAYVGFTGGTGGSTVTQNVLSWTFSTP
jgi:hypothetical protein